MTQWSGSCICVARWAVPAWCCSRHGLALCSSRLEKGMQRGEKSREARERKKRHDVLAFKIYNWLTWKRGFNVRTLFWQLYLKCSWREWQVRRFFCLIKIIYHTSCYRYIILSHTQGKYPFYKQLFFLLLLSLSIPFCIYYFHPSSIHPSTPIQMK